MKGNSLFKKIGAIATTAAMLASMGVTGFAADVESTATGTIVGTDDNNDGIYQVVVPYKSNVANTIGVTMLSYASAAENDSLESGDIANGYGTGMQIVGVDQINADDKTNGIGNGGIGSFTFYVDTTGSYSNEASGVIRMDKGEVGIVLLSGDAASGATGYLFRVGKADATVAVWTDSTAATTSATAPGYPASGQTGADYIEGLLTSTSTSGWAVKLGGNTVTEGIEVTATTDYDASNWKNQKITYTVDVESDEYNVTASTLQVEYPTKTWTANDTLTYPSTIYADPDEQTDMPAVTDYVKTELANKTVALTNGTYTYNYALTAEDIATVAAPENAVHAPGGSYNYTMTITGKTISDDEVTIPTVTVTIPVTIQADTRYEATSAKAFKGSAEVAAIANYNLIEGETKTVADLLTYVQGKIDTYKVYDNAEPATEGSATATWKLYTDEDATTEATGNIAAETTYYAVATVTPSDSENWKSTTVTITFEVSVEEGPAFACGDVDHQFGVRPADATAILRYLGGDSDYAYVGEREYEANVDQQYGIRPADATAILRHLGGAAGYETLPLPIE